MTQAGAPIAIVGMGAQFPGAPDLDSYWHNIVAGVDAITDVPSDRWGPEFLDENSDRPDRFYCQRGGFVTDARFDPAAFGVMPVAVDDAEPDQLIALQVAQAALDDAGGLGDTIDPERVGVILGRGSYLTPGVARLDQRVRGVNQVMTVLSSVLPDLPASDLARVEDAFRAQLGPERPEAAIGLVPNLAASRIANRLDLGGPAFTVDAACASSLLAVEHAVHALRDQRCDMVLAGGVHHCHDVTFWSVFTQLGALSRAGQIRPFDAAADGILIGEGTGVVALKRLDDAVAAGDRVYAVVRGVGSSSDGRAGSLMKPRVSGQVLALRRAWSDAGLDPASVGLVEAHGTATAAGDAAELATLAEVFGPADHRPRAGLGSVKSMIGHAMPAAGVAGLIKAAMAVHHRTLPPTLGCDDPRVGLESTRFRIIDSAEEWTADGPRRAAVNAFGFGGVNAHVVLDEHPANAGSAPAFAAPPPPASISTTVRSGSSATAPRPLLVAGASIAEVQATLNRPDEGLLAEVDPGRGPAQPIGGAGAVRLALVDPTVERLQLARKVVDRGRAWRGRSDLWFTPEPLLGPGRGLVAFCHPGVEPVFEPRIDDLTEHFAMPAVAVSTESIADQARSIVQVGRAIHQALARVGVTPDLELGHSIGEWTAMSTTGHVPSDRVDGFVADLDLAALAVADAWYVALGCAAADARALIAEIPGAVLSHDNCPHQSMVSADRAAVEAVLERARQQRILAQKLPFRSGFHTPFLRDLLGPFAAGLAQLPLEASHTPLWSATTVAPYPTDADEVRSLTLRHLLEPVRFTELIEAVYDHGVRAVVQVGAGSTTGFVDDALRGRDVLTVATNDSRRGGVDQLARAMAGLWVEGLEPNWTRLHDPSAASADPQATPRSTVGNRASSASGVALRLGAALVALDPALTLGPARPTPVRTATGGRSTDSLPDGSPLAAPFGRLLDTMDSATADVLDAFHRAPAADRPANGSGRANTRIAESPVRRSDQRGGTRPSGPTGPANGADPVLDRSARTADGRAGGPIPGAPTERLVEVSSTAMPWVLDHCFYRQAPGWPDEQDRFPVVPMTTMVDLMVREVERAHPGRVVVAMRTVQALKWLAAAPATEVAIRTAPIVDEPDQVKVTIVGHARAVAVLADRYPAPPEPVLAPLTDGRPSERTAAAMYRDRMMFHGPAFHGVQELHRLGTDGIDADLVSVSTPGALLDSAGQVMGYWLMATAERDHLALPVSIGEIAFHGPQPEAGTPVPVSVRVRELTDKALIADHELVVDGRVWCRITGWQDRRFQSDEVLWPIFIQPEFNVVTEAFAGGWELVRERWPDAATRELVLRRYTTATERESHDGLNPRAQRTWLLGRVAAKDAVRRRLGTSAANPMFPAEVGMTNDDAGRPVIHLDPAHEPVVASIAHVDRAAVAYVRPRTGPGSGPCGIDLVAHDTIGEATADHLEQLALTASERALVPDGADRVDGLARLWAVKEAAGKAAGTGLAGRPRALAVISVDGSRFLVDGPNSSTPTWVDTQTLDVEGRPHTVAWTTHHHGEQP